MIENFKNLLRHGKQGRQQDNYSHPQYDARQQQHAVSEPPPANVQYPAKAHPAQDRSVAAQPGGNLAPGAQAHHQAAQKQGQQQKMNDPNQKQFEEDVVARIVQEEKESKGKLPKYPGLERYRLIEKMGDGAFSNVYRAVDTHGEMAEVAIKVVRKYELNATQRANILKEVQIMRGLDHPNIVKLISFSESRSYYYLVLELLKGGELFHQIVRLTYFSEDLSRHVIIQVAQALHYLHEEKGVVHRDIKPENLLFEPIPFIPSRNPKPKSAEDEDKADEGEFIRGIGAGGIGRIKLADFGLSKVVWDAQTMTPCGTVGYTAPEIVKDERYSKSVDMWALGCVLYTLLCGFPPFYDESISVLTEKVARGQYTFLSPWWDDISKSAQDLISHLLTVDPTRRYSIEQFMQHPWIRQSNESTYAAPDAPPLATPRVGRDIMAEFGGYTPGNQRRMDFRSPGAVNLREVFDVGYAVHRMEEEGKRRKNWKQGYRGGAPGLNPPEEDEEGEEGDEGEDDSNGSRHRDKVLKQEAGQQGVDGVERDMQRANLGTKAQGASATAPLGAGTQRKHQQQKDQRKKNNAVFELTLENATLLGRRNKPGMAS